MSAAQIAVPQGVRRKLHAVRGRRRWLMFLSGTALAVAVFAGLLLAAMLLDWLVTPFDSTLRVVLTTVVLAAGAAAWIGWSLRPTFLRSPLPEIAGLVDAAVPQLEERWTTIADLSRSNDPPAMRGSDAMIGQVAREAERLEDLVEPERIVSGRGARPYLIGLCSVLALFAAIWLIDAQQMTVLWQRFWSPTQPISLTRVTSPTAEQVVPRHESLAIVGMLENRLREEATIWLRDPKGETTRQAMSVSTTDPAQFSFLVEDVAAPVEYRIRSGDGQTPWHRIDVADRPRLANIEFQITPPAYSHLPKATQAGLPRRTRALEGSVLEVAFTASEPLQEFTLQLGAGAAQSVAPAENGVYRFRQVLNEDFAFSPRLVSRHGLANEEPPNCQIIVYQDQFPSVAIESPESNAVVRPDDEIEIEFTAKDDFGIARAELVVTDAAHPEDAPLKVVEIPLGDQERQPDVEGRVSLDLKKFDLKQGASLSYSVRVFDTKNSAGDSRQSASPSTQQTADASESKSGEPQKPDESQNQLAKAGAGQNSADGPGQPPQAGEPQNPAENQNQLAKAGDTQKPADPTAQEAQDAAKSSSGSSSQNSKTAANTKPGKPSPTGKLEGAPKPGDNMQRRQLNLGQCSSCKPMNLKIDEWAGSFAGQMREKLELAIEEFLARMETALKDAEHEDQLVFDDISHGTAWSETHVIGARKAAGQLTTASDVAVELATKSAGTPYAFMGLQLAEIDERHVVVARGILQSVVQTPEEQRTDELKSSLFHIRRARELLARLSRTYDEVKINHKISEAMTHVAKMHQVFIEDTFKLLGSSRPNLNPKQRKFLELEIDEEFRNKLKALLEKKRDVQAELAKVLAENPELLRRYMAQARVDADSLRDQMTLLAGRQAELQGETKSRLETPGAAKGLLESQQARQALEAVEITQQAALMLENFETWLPKDLKRSDAAIEPVYRLYQELAISADQLAVAAVAAPADATATDPSTRAIENAEPAPTTDNAAAAGDQADGSQPKPETPNHGQRMYELLGQLQDSLPALTDGRPGHTKLITHVTNRLAEVGKLTTTVSGWLRKADAQQDAELVALIDQTDVTSDTAELTNKIANLKSWMAGLTPEIGKMAEDLLKTLEAELLIQQATAEAALEDRVTAIALVQQTQAVGTFARAEEQFDKLQQAIIDYLDSLPANTKPSLDGATPPSLEELLAMLEEEKLAAEGLGIPCCRPSNLSIVRDWMSPGKNSGGGMGGSMAAGALAQSQSAQQRAGRLQKSAEDFKRKLEAAMAAGANQQAGRDRPVNPRWNTLQSRLDDSLKQSRGQTLPPKYRSAIDLYFELISGVSDGGGGE